MCYLHTRQTKWLTWNDRGHISKNYSKLDNDEFRNVINDYNLFCLTETWSQEVFNYEIPEYSHYKSHIRPKKYGVLGPQVA